FFGMQLPGIGDLGAVAYGLVELELEAGDSGLRSFVSVQSALAMYAIHSFGSDEQKAHWLPRMASGDAIGCFGLSEPDSGSDPSSMRTTARRDGADWIVNGTKMWITNGGVSDVAVVWANTDDGIRGFLVPCDLPGFSAPDIHRKMSLRASVTSELVMDDVRLPAEQVSIGKLNNTREAIAIARTSRGILGANGITLEYPIMRHMTNLESVLTYEGTEEVHTLVVGHVLTGIRAFT